MVSASVAWYKELRYARGLLRQSNSLTIARLDRWDNCCTMPRNRDGAECLISGAPSLAALRKRGRGEDVAAFAF